MSKLADNTPAISCTEACLGEVPEDVVLERRHLAHPRLSLTTRCQNRRKLAGGQLFGAYNVWDASFFVVVYTLGGIVVHLGHKWVGRQMVRLVQVVARGTPITREPMIE